ncbi:hypothetical protein NQ317_001963 [Molorchus minor]|uniref:Uncharacterized protein n=1 Tax=Molorchus minor TaxID=1323400 RepID=A0ABQ9JAA5_9CUCU|nr:hypothetical protein NQ317_001963 [Molorchus minor]
MIWDTGYYHYINMPYYERPRALSFLIKKWLSNQVLMVIIRQMTHATYAYTKLKIRYYFAVGEIM